MFSIHHFNLVVTVALKQEIPADYFQDLGYPVVTLRGLKAGILSSIKTDKSVLFVVTGVGANYAKEAAEFIRDVVQPKYVVNVGTVGDISQDFSLGDMVIPRYFQDNLSRQIDNDTRIPFPVGYLDHIHMGGGLYSSLNRDASSLNADFIDMEAYFQAEVFKPSPITFHCIKSVSDYADDYTEQVFEKGLSMCRTNMKQIFGWVSRFNDEPDICVVIPTYNREKTIGKCLDSVLAQTLKPKDIIVVDDGSEDGTLSLLQLYKDDVTVVPVLENKGVSFSRNLGVQHSQADWICFLDSDDEWEPEKLEQQVAYLKANPYFDILQSQETWIRNGEHLNQKKYHEKFEGWMFGASLERCMISPSSVMLSRPLFNRYLGFDDKLLACEDYDLWLRITRFHPIGLDRSVSLIKFGGHDDQLSQKYEAMDQFRVKALLKLLDKEKEPLYRDKIKEILNQKITILVNGYEKRDNNEQVQYYENIRARVLELV